MPFRELRPLFVAGVPSWTQPTLTGVGRLNSRAPLIPFPELVAARTGHRDLSPWFINLSGVWSFRLKPTPDAVTWDDIADSGAEWDQIMVPGTWNSVVPGRGETSATSTGTIADKIEGSDAVAYPYGTPHYTNVLMPFPEEPPFTPADNNPTGMYRKSFALPQSWTDRRTLLQLGGTDSMHHVFVNGVAAGVGTDTRVTSEYDITDLLVAGSNELVVVVIRWSASSWLEDQDQWWMSGITREVTLVSVASTHIFHVRAQTGLDSLHSELAAPPRGTLDLEAHIRFAGGEPEFGWTVDAHLETSTGTPVLAHFSLDDSYPGPYLPGTLGGAQPGQVDTTSATSATSASSELKEADLLVSTLSGSVPILDRRSPGQTAHHGNIFPGHRVRFRVQVEDVKAWSSECPTRYRVICVLRNPAGEVVDIVTQLIGFRSVAIAERELLLNTKAVLIRGVNRHDHDEHNAASPSRSTMRLDIEVMKQNNVNAVRMSHYPPDPYVLDVCDELGLWVIDETNLETHARYRSLLHDPAYQSACLERLSRMVQRDENHPSIFAWSLGNESGYAPIHDAMAAWVRHYDPTRVVHYEGPHRYDLGPHGPVATDIVCPMYPSLDRLEAWALRQASEPDDHRPLILCEYSHAMGNSNGSLADHDELFRSHHGLQGGFIWEWIDHGLHVGTGFDGRPVWAYGGHFGEEPHDGPFVADGLVWPDRTAHPGLLEAKHVWRPARVSLTDHGSLLVVNDRNFTSLDDLAPAFELLVNGRAVLSGVLPLPTINPGTSIETPIPGDHTILGPHDEAHLTIRWTTKSASAWAPQGHLVAWDQVALPLSGTAASTHDSSPLAASGSDSTIEVHNDVLVCKGLHTTIEHRADGTLATYRIDGSLVLDTQPEVRIWRAFIDNDGVAEGVLGLPGIGRIWDKWNLRGAALRSTTDVNRLSGSLRITHDLVFSPPGASGVSVTINETRSFSGDGVIHYVYKAIVPEELGDLPRLGTVFSLTELEQLEWFGLGPHETYSDRRSAGLVARHQSTVTDQYVPYIHPQDHGRHEACRWLAVRNEEVGLVFAAHPDSRLFSGSARHFDDGELSDARTTDELIPRAKTIVSIDHRVRGVGTGSCGPDTLPAYRIGAGTYEWAFAVAPLISRHGQAPDPQEVVRAIRW